MLTSDDIKWLEKYCWDAVRYSEEGEPKHVKLTLQLLEEYKRLSEPHLSAKQVPLGEITQEMLNQYYVYLETPNGNKAVNRILPTGNDRVVLVYVDGGEYIKFRTTLALVTSVPK